MSTLNRNFQETVSRYGAKTALRYKEAGEYRDITYADLAARVQDMASGLTALGVEKGDRVSILAENCPEWAITDLATLALGGIVIPIYPTLPAAQVGYIVRNSGAKVLVVADAKQLGKVAEVRGELTDLQHVVVIEEKAAAPDQDVKSFADVIELGKKTPLDSEAYAARWKSVTSDDVASIVYTSGTTGDPKGAMLTHGNFVWDVDASLKHFATDDHAVTHTDTFFSFLPVCHAYERTTGYYLPIRVGATIAYSAGLRTLADDMQQVKPTLMVCVPRVYEAMMEQIEGKIAKAPAEKREGFHKALEVGKEYDARVMDGKSPGPILAAKRLVFDKLAYSTVRDGLGGNFRFLVSGGAALSADTARFFGAIGIPISEGYGMTEAAPVIAANPVGKRKIGTVGTVLQGGEWKIAGDGEILYRGPNVMKGYWNNPTATGEMIDGEGWLHTGDVGNIDDDGYLKITDRKKDIIVLANGKNVAPQPIEAKLKQSPFLSEVVLIGDKQSVVTALVIANKGKLTEWAKEQNLTFADEDALLELPEVRKKIKGEIDAQSKDLADFEKVKKFTLLNTVFSVETGEMTPTLKVKRKVVAQKYAKEIAAMRGGEE